jgi:signal transduction histidine kinase
MPDHVPVPVEELTCGPVPGPGSPTWHLFYAAVYLVCTAMVETGPLSPDSRIIASVALALMVPWYLLAGRPIMVLDEADWMTALESWRGLVYLTGMAVLFIAVVIQNNNAWFLSFVLSAQCFHVTNLRRGMGFVIVMNGTAGIIMAGQHPGLQNKLTAAAFVVFAIGFSWVYSLFTLRMVAQNMMRAALIEQLTATRHELAAAHHEAGALAERHRLAGEIHDTLAQGFTSIVTLIQAATADLRPDQPDSRRLLDLALVTARDNLAEARALVAGLGAADLTGGPGERLGDVLSRITSATGAETGIGAESLVEGMVRSLPTGTEVVLLRVCQEALSNVRKHAKANAVQVRLRYGDDAVRLEVADDGGGFDCATATGGYGLGGMRERVQQVGGTVRVDSAPGAGTVILAEVPLSYQGVPL